MSNIVTVEAFFASCRAVVSGMTVSTVGAFDVVFRVCSKSILVHRC